MPCMGPGLCDEINWADLQAIELLIERRAGAGRQCGQQEESISAEPSGQGTYEGVAVTIGEESMHERQGEAAVNDSRCLEARENSSTWNLEAAADTSDVQALCEDVQELCCTSHQSSESLLTDRSEHCYASAEVSKTCSGRLRMRAGKKPARNRECPCGSKKRYKNCCGPAAAAAERRRANPQASEELPGNALPAISV
jgi:hypothetical protein